MLYSGTYVVSFTKTAILLDLGVSSLVTVCIKNWLFSTGLLLVNKPTAQYSDTTVKW
jgi:hypothetical protein